MRCEGPAYSSRMNEQVQPLAAATAAPNFVLQYTRRTSVSLHGLPARPIVLAFYPSDWEPVSEQQLSLYQDYLIELERLGASLLAISDDNVWSHDAFARFLRLRFPLLSDTHPRGAAARRYGVYREREERNCRALFVVDGERIIRFSQVYPDDLNPGVNDILMTLEAMTAEGADVHAYRASQAMP